MTRPIKWLFVIATLLGVATVTAFIIDALQPPEFQLWGDTPIELSGWGKAGFALAFLAGSAALAVVKLRIQDERDSKK